MALLGYTVPTTEMGAFIVTGGDDKEVDAEEYCSFPTYFNLWKRDFLDLKVSRPVEDICKDCYVFANHHRYLANRTMGCNDDDGEGNSNGNGNSNSNGDSNGNGNNNDNADSRNGKGKRSNYGCSNDSSNNDGSKDFSDVGVHPIRNVDLNCLDAVSTKADEERELMLLQAAAHIKMARAQRALYQAKVADAVADAIARKNTW
jgi:hypothetical protein